MPRANTQKAIGQKLCAVKSARYGWNEEGERVLLEINLEDERTYDTCGRSKKAHGASVKNPITSHPYGGEDGTEIEVRFPVCGVCNKTIAKGEQYRFWKPRYGARHTRCMTCPAPSRSVMTNSEILSMAWGIADDNIEASPDTTQSDMDDLRDDYASQIGDIVDLIQEKMDNIESGFGHTSIPAWEELDERRSMYEQWQEEVEAVDFSDFEDEIDTDDEDAVCSQCEVTQGEHDDEDHEFSAEPTFDVDGAIDALQDALGNCPE